MNQINNEDKYEEARKRAKESLGFLMDHIVKDGGNGEKDIKDVCLKNLDIIVSFFNVYKKRKKKDESE